MTNQALAKRLGNPAWVKGGASPNPKGRPRTGLALSEKIRQLVDPAELAQLALDIARGNSVEVKIVDPDTGKATGTGERIVPKTSDRVRAISFLADHGYVKPPTTIALETGKDQTVDLSKLSMKELEQYEALLDIVTGKSGDAP